MKFLFTNIIKVFFKLTNNLLLNKLWLNKMVILIKWAISRLQIMIRNRLDFDINILKYIRYLLK